MHCLVTGASGYLGRALLPALAGQGHQLSAQFCSGSLPDAPMPDCTSSPVTPEVPRVIPLRCDLREGVDGLPMDGVDVLLHLAGIAHQRADPSSYQRVNVDASLNLARNALAAGVKRFVFVSSVKAAAVAAPPSGDKAGRSAPSDYARSKALAESGLADICRDSAMQLVILRPALIYSPDALGHLRWLRRWAELRLPAPPEGGGRSMVAREDVVRLLLMLSDVSLEVPGLLTVTDGEVYSTRRLYEALCQSLGRKPWLPTPPPALWRGASGIFDQLRNDAPGTLWERLLGDDCYAPEGLDALGFEPALSFEQSLGVRS